MKRIIIILMIAVCLLSFIEVPCLAQGPYNYGELWNSLSNHTKSIYIMGLKDGLQEKISLTFNTRRIIEEKNVLDKYFKDPEVVKIEEVRNSALWDFIMFDDEAIKDVMTDLYGDPANTYIPFYDMGGIAYRKLKGEDIEPLLRGSRKRALLFEK